jgi:integral membrane protein
MSESARSQSVGASLTRYRVLAYATGVFLLLLTLHVIVQWRQSVSDNVPFSDADGLGRYLAYVVASLDLWFRTRLPAGRMVLVVLAGTVPGMSFVAERWVTGRVRPMAAAIVERVTR